MPRVKPNEITPGSSSAVTWKEVAGLDEAKAELQEVIDFLREPERFESARGARPEGDPLPRPARHRQDAGGEGGRERVRGPLLRAERLGVRRDVRRARRGPHPQALRRGAQQCAVDRLHRRARRCRPRPQRQLLEPRAGPDAQPAPGRAGRVRPPRPGGGDGGLEPAPGPRPGTASAGAVRPPDYRPAARPQGRKRHPRRPHPRQAARAGRRSRAGRAENGRADRRRPREHLQRGRDLGRPPRRTCRSASSTSSTRWTA